MIGVKEVVVSVVIFMKKIEGHFGYAEIRDCVPAMQQFPAKFFDLCFTDIYWGIGYDSQNPHGINTQTNHPERVNYKDTFDPELYLEQFGEMRRVSKQLVMAVGWKNYNWWVKNTNPRGTFILTFNNGQNSSKIAKHNATSPYLCWGERFVKFKFWKSFHHTYIENGFLREKDYKYKHGSPKDFKTWNELICQLKPTSLIDPFIGSGTAGEVAEANGINWIGFELKPDYIEDIKFRINRGKQRYKTFLRRSQMPIKKHKQSTLDIV